MFLAFLLGAALGAGFHGAQDDKDEAEDRILAVAAHNAFARDLYRVVSAQDGNLCVSPTSALAGLWLTHPGARGETAAEIERVLGVARDEADSGRLAAPDAAAAFAALVRHTTAEHEHVEVRVVSALWGQTHADFLAPTLAELERVHGAGLRRVDFRADPGGALEAINAWVADATRDRIRGLLTTDDLSAKTRLVLTNALYLKAPWFSGFRKDETRLAPAYRPGPPPLPHRMPCGSRGGSQAAWHEDGVRSTRGSQWFHRGSGRARPRRSRSADDLRGDRDRRRGRERDDLRHRGHQRHATP